DEGGTNGFSYMYQWFTGSGNRAGGVSETLRNKFDRAADLRFPLVTKEYQAGWEMRKYISGDISSTLNKTCQVAYPVYRYSDMLLLQAEALARLSKWEEALDLVKLVRTRAGLDTPQASDFATEDELVDFILDERQRELLGEGRRWFDLVRTGRWKSVMGPINGCSEDGNEFFPIHYSHLDQNKALRQNAYYAQNQE
ncbi:MAG: RagB/SusD family nutrient uptake outer membrane protein, partial [Alistipes sp.]|nr:RagB/SusD family nutrient uptake outer membrane protein [Alistipes sp.]